MYNAEDPAERHDAYADRSGHTCGNVLEGYQIVIAQQKKASALRSGGISGAIVELLGAESRSGSFGSREQRLDDMRESQMGYTTPYLEAFHYIRWQLYLSDSSHGTILLYFFGPFTALHFMPSGKKRNLTFQAFHLLRHKASQRMLNKRISLLCLRWIALSPGLEPGHQEEAFFEKMHPSSVLICARMGNFHGPVGLKPSVREMDSSEPRFSLCTT